MYIIGLFTVFSDVTSGDMAAIAKVNKNKRYYTATPEIVKAYATMELKEDL